jgi:hypothetical protein
LTDSEYKSKTAVTRAQAAREPAQASSASQPSEEALHSASASRKKQSTPDSSYQNYLFGHAGSDEHPAWSDSTSGRAAIRLVSRGIVGAAFFTIGGRIARSQMAGYQEQHWKWDSSKPLQAIAKGIDATLGQGIKSGVRMFANIAHTPEHAERIAKNAVTFRQKRRFEYIDDHGKLQTELGRSYGADIVSFTFDFAAASVGDALTRNVIQAFDPNVKKSWLVNDEGAPAARGEKKHFLLGEGLKAFGRSSWRILSKNQGEDWAAAIPYAFQMKFQRQFLSSIFNKRFDGHKLVFDQNWNGGAYRVNKAGQIVGDYQLVGAMDLHARFVGYNWYTLMFREGYDTVANAFKHWKQDGYAIHAPRLPEHFNPITTPIDAAAHAMRYVAKSFIKANMYMNPAVIPFWVMRTSQSKWRGRHYIQEGNPELGQTATLGPEAHVWTKGGLKPYAAENYEHYPTETTFDRFEKRFSQGMNWIGRGQYRMGINAGRAADALDRKGLFPRSNWFNNLITYDVRGRNEAITEAHLYKGRHNFMHEYLDASLAYTPYMFAKAELGLRVDDTKGDGSLGQMDKAIYRFMDNVASFNLKGTVGSLKEMWRLGSRFEREVPVREGGMTSNDLAARPVTTIPETKIDATSVQQQSTARLKATNDNTYSANDNHESDAHDKSWVQSVIGREINPAHIHAATPTRH